MKYLLYVYFVITFPPFRKKSREITSLIIESIKMSVITHFVSAESYELEQFHDSSWQK